nr:FGGY family of carbohydrate kinase [Tanacetum cinerariifolium]GEW35141.1 FGGY family of carbohydrate kinase [Tanacetum cinerariifolium]
MGSQIDTLLASGGLSKNSLFIQEHADITGCSIIQPRESEAVLLDAAILRVVAAKKYPRLREAMKALNATGLVEDTNQSSSPPIAPPEAPQMVSFVKLLILKKGEYILWTMKIEQYLAHTDYALWEVILNGNGEVHMTKYEASNEVDIPLVTAKQNVSFVSTKSTSSTNELNAAYSVSTAAGHSSQAQEQIDQDDLEEMDLKWQVECFNCHRRGHFARDCRTVMNPRNKGRDTRNTGYRGRDNGKRPAKDEDEKALVVQDGLVTYDWSYQLEEEETDFTLMDFTSNPSSSSSLNFEVQSCSKQCVQSYEQLKNLFDEQRKKLRKANLEIVGYQYGLESIEGQLCIHQQNEVIYEENIRVLEYDVNDKSNLLKYTQKQLDEALREKEDLKAKLEKFETSSKSLTKLLDSQISEKVKTGLAYDSQLNEKEVFDVKEEEVIKTVFDNCSSDEEHSQANDRFKKGEGFHAVPPPLTGNYMPPKPDLSFARLDDSIYKFKISEIVTSLSKDVKDASKTSTTFIEKPKEVRTIVFTRSGRIPVSAAKPKAAASTSATKPVNTARPKQSVNFSNSRSNFHKSHSPIRRYFYNATAHSRSNSTKRVNIAGSKAVSAVKGKGVTTVKASAGSSTVSFKEQKNS